MINTTTKTILLHSIFLGLLSTITNSFGMEVKEVTIYTPNASQSNYSQLQSNGEFSKNDMFFSNDFLFITLITPTDDNNSKFITEKISTHFKTSLMHNEKNQFFLRPIGWFKENKWNDFDDSATRENLSINMTPDQFSVISKQNPSSRRFNDPTRLLKEHCVMIHKDQSYHITDIIEVDSSRGTLESNPSSEKEIIKKENIEKDNNLIRKIIQETTSEVNKDKSTSDTTKKENQPSPSYFTPRNIIIGFGGISLIAILYFMHKYNVNISNLNPLK